MPIQVTNAGGVLDAFIRAACVPRNDSHASGSLDEARLLLAANPGLPRLSIHAAAIVGDDEQVQLLIAADSANATRKGGPYGWDALTHLCFSRFLRLERDRSPRFVRAAGTLLDAGASANAGFFEAEHRPNPEWESVLYGAAGVAHDEALTRLLVARGADVNDGEVTYHTPETYDNGAMIALLESGRLTPDSLAVMLLRKADWHDIDGIRSLLEHGADPNRITGWGNNALHNAVLSDNGADIVQLMLDHGADPTKRNERKASHAWRGRGQTAVAMAAWCGRADLLELFQARGLSVKLDGLERLVAACALDDKKTIESITRADPKFVEELRSAGGDVLSAFARTGNVAGVRHLLDLGLDPNATISTAHLYWDLANGSTALHAAAWLSRPEVVRVLVERGAVADASDAKGRTPLALAVRACVDSYWTERRSPDSVAALLRAGANANAPTVKFPSGYEPVDALLAKARLTM